MNNNFCLCGKVLKGFGMDTKINNFPTANISLDLSHGIYIGTWENKNVIIFKGFRDDNTSLVHVIDYDGNLYDKNICISNIIQIPNRIFCEGRFSPCEAVLRNFFYKQQM